MSELNRDNLRIKFKENFNYDQIGCKQLNSLKELLVKELSAYKNVSLYNTFTMRLARLTIKDGTKDLIGYVGAEKYVFFKLKGIINDSISKPFYHFKDRECISFNPGGFIGFAGWADDRNVQPILKAFDKWMNEMITKD